MQTNKPSPFAFGTNLSLVAWMENSIIINNISQNKSDIISNNIDINI